MKNRIVYLVIPIVVFLSACKSNFERDYAGPLLCPTDRFADVQVLQVKDALTDSVDTVDLSTHSLSISAKFNESIPWTVKITGKKTGAVKTFTGTSNQVSLTWIGESDAAPFFGAELLKVDLFIACKKEVHQTWTIANTANPSFTQLPGFICNFNQTITTTLPSAIGQYVQDPISPGIISGGSDYVPSPQGGSYISIIGDVHAGDPLAGPQWYYGAFDFANLNLNKLNSDPSKVFINFYVSNNGVPNSAITLAIYERFNGLSKKKTKTFNITWTGWKMISMRLSDIAVIDPRKIYDVNFGLGSYLHEDLYGAMNVDFITFTNDKPFFTQE